MRKLKEYTLDNGDVVTSQSLRDLGLTKDMVYYRLKKSTDPKLIYKGLKKNKKEKAKIVLIQQIGGNYGFRNIIRHS